MGALATARDQGLLEKECRGAPCLQGKCLRLGFRLRHRACLRRRAHSKTYLQPSGLAFAARHDGVHPAGMRLRLVYAAHY